MAQNNPFNFLAHLDTLLNQKRNNGPFILLVLVLWRLLSLRHQDSGFDDAFAEISDNKAQSAQLILKSMQELEERHPKYASGIFSQIPLRDIPELTSKAWHEVYTYMNKHVDPEPFAKPGAAREFCEFVLELGFRDLAVPRMSTFELYKFTAEVLKVQNEEKVMFPGCGLGLTALACLNVAPDSNVYAQDTDLYQVLMTKILFALFGQEHSRVVHGDILTDPAFKSGADRLAYFDYVISYPPWGFLNKRHGYLRRDKYGRFPDMLMARMNYETAFLAHTIRVMHPRTGQACLIFPARFLNMESCTQFRNYMITSNLIDIIISLPRYLFAGNSVDCIMLILKADKLTKDILFVDGEYFSDPKTRTIDTKSLLKVCEERKGQESSMNVSHSVIADNDANLHPLIYKKPKQDDLKSLQDLKKEVTNLEKELEDISQNLMNRLEEIEGKART